MAGPATTSPLTFARACRATGRSMIVLGLLVGAFAAFQLWGTGLAEARAQHALGAEFEALLASGHSADKPADGVPESDVSGPASPTGDDRGDVSPTGDDRGDVSPDQWPERGDPIARIEIPSIGLDKVVVEGVQVDELRTGPGRYRSTAALGGEGNAAVAGHRTTYGQPFRDIDRLSPGDQILVTTVAGVSTYEVMTPEDAFGESRVASLETGAGHTIVRPSAGFVLDEFGDTRLTLTACHPTFSARERIVVVAVRVDGPGAHTASAEPGPDGGSASSRPDGVARQAPPVDEITLDEGLAGDRGALVPALLYLALAVVGYQLARWAGRRFGRVDSYLLASFPVAATVWLAFGQIDRLLPAY